MIEISPLKQKQKRGLGRPNQVNDVEPPSKHRWFQAKHTVLLWGDNIGQKPLFDFREGDQLNFLPNQLSPQMTWQQI